jgi:HPt (histidine-containing phosphotransfer) domain-containing protein
MKKTQDEFKIPKAGVDKYVSRRKVDVQLLQSAIKIKQTSDFFKIGHCLQGNAAPFGFPELESLGLKLEKISESKDWAAAEKLVDELETWCKNQFTIRGLY